MTPRTRHQPPPPTGDPVRLPPPGQQPAARRTASGPELARAASSARLFLLLAICSLIMSARPLPWGATALLFSLPAVWFGVQAVRHHRTAGSGRGTTVAVSVGVGLATFVVLGQLLTLALWPVQWDYERCRAEALSVTALERCDAERADRLSPEGLLGSPG